VETWLNGVLRETLVDTEPEEDIGVTVVVPEQVKGNEEDRIYPRLPSDDSESDSEWRILEQQEEAPKRRITRIYCGK